MPEKKQTMEQRTTNGIEIRAKSGEGEDQKTIGGYALRYNQPTRIIDWWGDEFLEEFARGAFDESIQQRTVKALWNHDTSSPLGSTKSGTLRFNDDAEGLNYDVDLPGNTWGTDAYESVMRGDVDGSSFGFFTKEEKWSVVDYEGKKIDKRTITRAELIEVSPCTFPAYESSEIKVRSFEALKEEKNKPDQKNIEMERFRTEILMNL
ncbi:HK97 family phage prohead protease [Acetobacterium wieringae]|uniref:Caudovirus prohead protease n=1 Tax=Acetobacterium wieringae TaxID=52694 RepID=A0A1F2PEI7_9FIRM|nr:HK97 family phage prohead protease [Acetobacterium wieringae]OFV69404.1 caudovirus prohead protease [Acetobacterium wieringae]